MRFRKMTSQNRTLPTKKCSWNSKRQALTWPGKISSISRPGKGADWSQRSLGKPLLPNAKSPNCYVWRTNQPQPYRTGETYNHSHRFSYLTLYQANKIKPFPKKEKGKSLNN